MSEQSTSEEHEEQGHGGEGKVVFFIDQERFEAPSNELTPRTILTDYAKEDPTQNILVLIRGKDKDRLESLDTPITVKNGTHFTIFHQGPTPVS